MDKIKVLMLSIWYPLSMSRYFERAFLRNPEVELKTVGPYTGSWIPWMGGMNLLEKYAVAPDIVLPFPPNVGRVAYELVQARLDGWKPDIVVTVDAGICWISKPSEGIVTHVATDPHCLDYSHARSISDKFFNMQAAYAEQDDIYMPYAYDPTVHYPLSTTVKDTDAVLIGMPYEHRVQWVNELRRHGVSVIFENGPSFDEYREINNRARIGLNWSSLMDTNARAFELAAMKLAPVMNITPDMGKFFTNMRDYMGFVNLSEAVANVIWLKNNPGDLVTMAENAYRAVLPHTYDSRVKQILENCGYYHNENY